MDETWSSHHQRRFRPFQTRAGGGPSMHSVFYIIGVVVVVLAILSLLGLT
jgi:hypothetical protein